MVCVAEVARVYLERTNARSEPVNRATEICLLAARFRLGRRRRLRLRELQCPMTPAGQGRRLNYGARFSPLCHSLWSPP